MLHNAAAYLFEQIVCHECAYDTLKSCLSRQLIRFLEQGLWEFAQYGSQTHTSRVTDACCVYYGELFWVCEKNKLIKWRARYQLTKRLRESEREVELDL